MCVFGFFSDHRVVSAMPEGLTKLRETIHTLRTVRRIANSVVFVLALLGHKPDGHTAAPAYAASRELVGESCPSFAVRLENGTFVEHTRPTGRRDEAYLFADTHLEAVVTPLPNHQWELKIKTKNDAVKEIWFPWEPQARFLNERLDDDVLYYPHLMGLAWAAQLVSDSKWEGQDYPGYCFSPLAVIADGHDARIVAAANWPPTRVFVQYARYRLGLRYDVTLPANSVKSFIALVATVHADASTGDLPWHLAVDLYKKWLLEKMKSDGLYPIPYPSWMKKIDGWQNVQLENLRDSELSRVREDWDRYKRYLPWFQMWGQMSNFFPTDGEETGCCLDRPGLHRRYRSVLPDFVRTVAAEGRVGFYSRPRSPYKSMTGTSEADKSNLRFILDWVGQNREELGANAFYIDVLGAVNFGDPMTIARMFGDKFPRETVIEHSVDIYPTAFLISGSLWGGRQCDTTPGQTIGQLDKDLPCVTFPRFGRYVMDDRLIFLGESNGDHVFWGTTRGHDYWTERQVFLLGAKFDAMRVSEGNGVPPRINRALERIIKERKRVEWWAREPVYLDTRGLSDVPAGIEVRRFRGIQGEDLLVIDNWRQRRGQQMKLLGRPVSIPKDPIAILVMEP